jgi:hypothetical protein
MECIYCKIVLSDTESANGGKICETCYADNDCGHQYDGDDEELDETAEAEMNCGMGPDGQCSQAGSEWCDWNCPFSR